MAPHAELIADAEAVGNSECVKPYIDPMLANSPVHMGKFFARLFKCRMLQLIPGRREHTIGVFFVLKKSGKLRLILDTRKAKTYFRKPRASHLPTPAAWTCILRVVLWPTLFTGWSCPRICVSIFASLLLSADSWTKRCGRKAVGPRTL